MTSDRWDQIRQVLDQLDGVAPEALPGLLEAACGGDQDLRREVESLLSFEKRAEALDRAARPSGGTGVPGRIGPYRVERLIGAGGMGAVYLAVRDDDQYRKQVAIKVTATAGDSDLLDRFRAERQIVAGLDHPYIARLLDGGSLADGRPYFVMEYVAGRRIDVYAAEQKLDTAAVLRLFLKVCAAVQFAHKNLVVHRDLKAGNILVSEDGDPHLLDFGIAKVLDPAAHTNVEITQTLLRRMTPASASPEQVAGKAVTVSTDVYALGVLLYRLLTGASAYAGATGFETDPATAILQYEPPPASRAPGVPPKLRRVLAGDLDNVLHKAAEKEPARRYASVEEFAADIGRYLQGHPVEARRASALQRTQKFLARHRATVTAGLAVGAMAATAGAVLVSVSTPGPPRVLRSVQLTHFGFGAGVVATDGNRVYFDARTPSRHGIVQIPVDGGDPVDVPAPSNASLRDISPDRFSLLVECAEGRDRRPALWTLPLHGGLPRRLVESPVGSARWSRDGTRIALCSEGFLSVVNPDGSGLRKLAPGAFLDGWSPNGKLIRFSRVNGAIGGMSLWEVRSDGSQLRAYLPDRQNPGARWGEGEGPGLWMPDGKYFLFREFFEHRTTLWAMRERAGMWPLRRPQPVEFYAAGFDIYPWAPPAVSPDGKRVFVLTENETHDIVRYDQAQQSFVPMLTGVSAIFRGYSPDGRWIAYTTLPASELWRARPDGSDRRQLTFPPVQAFGGVWLPDSSGLAVRILPPGGKPGKICLAPVDGEKTQVLFENEPTAEDGPTFSPDGRSMGFGRAWLDAQGNTTAGGAYLLDRRSGKISKLSESDDDIESPVWSPDGRRMAAKSGNGEVKLFDPASRQWRPIVKGVAVQTLVWSRDSRFLYYQDLSAKERQVYRVAVPGGRIEAVAAWKQLVRSDWNVSSFGGLTPDGQPVATFTRRHSDIYGLDLDLP